MNITTELELIRKQHVRNVFAMLARRSGVQTAPGLGYLVARMRWHLGDRKRFPTRPKGMRPDDATFIETRARALLADAEDTLPPIKHP